MAEKKEKIKRLLYKRILRIFFISLLILLCLLIAVVLLIQTAPVQNFLRGRAVAYLQGKLHTRVEVGRIYIGFPKDVVIENVFLEDQKHDTLFSAGKLSANIAMMKLLHNEVEISDFSLQHATIKIKRQLPDTDFNFQFIITAFSSADKKPAKENDTSSTKISVKDVSLDDIRAVYDDVITGNDIDVSLKTLSVHVGNLDFKNESFEIPDIDIDGLNGKVYQNNPLVSAIVDTHSSASSSLPKFMFKNISVKNIGLDYRNNPSALFAILNVGDLSINAKIFDLNKRLINLDKLDLSKTTASVRLGKTVSKKEPAKNSIPKPTDTSGWRIMVKQVLLDGNNISFDDDNSPRQKKGMDYAHIKSDETTLHVDNLLYSDDSIAGNITKGMLTEQSGFNLQNLQGEFLYGKKQAYIKNFRIQTPGTSLQRSVALSYPSLDTLKKNIKLLMLDVDLRNSKIQVKDILIFAPSLDTMAAFKNPNTVFEINTRIKGSIADLKIEQLQFSGLNDTKIDATGYIKGLSDMKSTQANLAMKNISTSRNDILSFISEKNLPSNIVIPKKLNINGQINGDMKNLFTDLFLNTSSGNATVKGNFKNVTDSNNISYNATVTTTNLDLGYILKNDSAYGPVSLQVKAIGHGTNVKTANADIEGTIHSAIYKKYNYQNAYIKANLSNHIAKVDLSIHDPDISLSLNGTADMNTKYPAINIHSKIDSINAKQLHFTSDEISYRGVIDADFPVSDPDHLNGNLLIENSLLLFKTRRIKLDTIKLFAGQTDTGQFLRLYADVIDAELRGKYKLTEMGNVFQRLIEPYFSTMKSKISEPAPYHFFISANIHNGVLIKDFVPTMQRLDPITFQGQFDSEKGWLADLNSPLILFADSRIQNFQLHAKPNEKSVNIQTSLQQFSSRKSLSLYNTLLDVSIADNKIDFALNIQDKSSKDKYHIAGLVQSLDSGEYYFSLKSDKLLLSYEKWNIAGDNKIEYSPTYLLAHNFNLSKGSEELNINTRSNKKNAPLEIAFNKFLLSTLTGFLGTDSLISNGELNGEISLINLQSKPTFTSDLNIKDLSVYKDTIGNISLKVNNTEENKFTADVKISGRGNEIALNGDYYVKPDNNSDFSLNLDIRNLELASVVGITAGSLKSASGAVNGKFSFNGTIDKPQINGNITFNKAAITPAMLNSFFSIDQQNIQINNDGITFHNFTVLDSAKNKLVLDGKASTTDFKHYNFDFTVNAKNFQALNSTKRDNKLYYGQLFFNAKLNMKGTEKLPKVDGNIKINEKTKLTIVMPQDEPGVQDREGIVQFVDMKSPQRDSILKTNADSVGNSSLVGFDVTTNISIDSNAMLDIIVDPANGDHLVAKGQATLTGGIDPSGKTTLSGNYQLSHGSYDFTLSVLHKQFDIQNGSTIAWTGEPTNANLNITAIYSISTPPIDLVSNQLSQTQSNINIYQQKLPFNVYLKMTGELLKPQISFDIELPEDKAYMVSKDVVSTVQAKLQMIRQDQGEMNKQVFALLLLGRFVGDDPFASNAAGTNANSLVRASVRKILSQQLNQLASNLIHGVDINFDLQSTDDYTTGQLQNRTDLNVTISKRLLNDRLRVSVGSNFELEGPQNVNANQQSNNVAGNIALDYKLSKDGRYLLRAYRRNDYDDVIEGYVIETGIGFIITVDYNHFKEIFESKKRKQKTNQDNDSESGKTD